VSHDVGDLIREFRMTMIEVSNQPAKEWGRESRQKWHISVLVIFVLYVVLRSVAWHETILFEGTDSLGYLRDIKVILSLDVSRIWNLDPDSTPVYPLFGALLSLPGWGLEIGARLASLFFSCVLFAALLGLGKHIAGPVEVTLGLLMVSFSPVLISNSFSIMSEPTYVGLIYLGLWLWWGQYENPVIWKGALLGVVYGLAFLTRVEGILYLAIIPFLQGTYTYFGAGQARRFMHFICWSLIYVVCFSVVAMPQIWRVSQKVGMVALNGRQVWSIVLNNQDGKPHREKLFGLDFSPAQINIQYLKTHAEVLQSTAQISPNVYIKKVISNFYQFCRTQLGILVGPIGMLLFGLGVLAMFQSGHRFQVFVILAFISFSLVGPLLHNVAIRHIVVIAPMIFLVGGIGIGYASHKIVESHSRFAEAGPVLATLLLCATVVGWISGLRSTFNPPHYNSQYSLIELREPIRIVKTIAENELGRSPIITGEREYLAYFTGATQFYVPYTNYQGLVKYCELNDVDLLYMTHRRLRKFPFFEEFTKGRWLSDYALLYAGVDAYGEKVELYRFVRDKESFDS